MTSFAIRERDGSGGVIAVYRNGQQPSGVSTERHAWKQQQDRRRAYWFRLMSDMFLPEGYPSTVSSDYLQYQIWNALQAFCSSLAGLFASRAVLQGHGVGNASASATNAVFLTVIQDVFSRLTTVVAGYYLGTSLYPEAKTYRLLADILNDAAIISDTLSPHLAHLSLSMSYPFVSRTDDSWLRVVALCMSGAFRALCGTVAGGSKAALTIHFATAGEKLGDVGDLSAKDGSKETVLALLGMLCGSIVLHYVHSAQATYLVLLSLVSCHLTANFVAVRVIAMPIFNRQRASLAWTAFRAAFDDEGNPVTKPRVPDYLTVSRREGIFTNPARIPCYSQSSDASALCALGISFSSLSRPTTQSTGISRTFRASREHRWHMDDEQIASCVEVFTGEKYILWFTSDVSTTGCTYPPSLGAVLKDGHGTLDHLKAWAHAHEVARLVCRRRNPSGFNEQLAVVRDALTHVSRMFPLFVDAAKVAGWKTEEGALVGGSPVTIVIEPPESTIEDRKNI
ncbi:DUF647-domain-containing protein [Trametes punicea]|nr:DUF647-domain-containing protein [Trametes punicea]